ncbi:PEP-CTERM sorting domain-containing protein [Aliiglaciecola sp. NS0011-25]|uniref:PEP-CTERM sorting domain-containing protein n=1 Tax=Aliiglaciecola sp. NS0011-25 TaxID=3127654 RepID=UPI0031045B03
MNKLIAGLSFIFFSSFATATIINFDADANGVAIAANTPITNQYQSLGVTFAGFEDGVLADIAAAPDPDGVTAPSSPNVLTNCANATSTCPGNRADIVEILFASSASNISLMLDTLGSSSVTFNLFDMNDLLIETQSITSGLFSAYVPVSFAATGVKRIEGLQPADGWAWAMDDLSFDAADVPEPSSLALMSLIVLCLGFARKRAS